MEISVGIEDAGSPHVQALVARHRAFAAEHTPPDHVHALPGPGLVDPAVTVIGVRRGGELVAIGALRRLDDTHSELKSMHVAREARGLGLGRRLLERLLQEARDRGARRVSLETGSMEAFAPARSLYERAGFVPCPPFAAYTDNPFSTCMTLELPEGRGEAGLPRAGEAWDGEDYQRRIAAVTASVDDPHGEANLVASYGPRRVLDAGCGTGRVAIELARRGVEVVGVDVDGSMLATARRLAPHLRWIEHDLTDLALGERFDVVVMAGNVPLFTPPGTTRALVAACADHLADGGVLVAGFSLDRGYGTDDYDADAAAAGLGLLERWSTWDRDPWTADATYAVSVHGRGA